ncbi:MAG: HDIG domain-containing protein [Bacteroidia bacterium]|nr:HDIG domain-containing protein [Bacteroidia bacterium]
MRNSVAIFFRRKLRERSYLYRYGIIISYLILMTLMMPRAFRLDYQYEVGKKWEASSLRAPFDFAILKSSDSLEIEQNRFAAQVLDIYKLDTSIVRKVKGQNSTFISEIETAVKAYQRAISQKDSAVITSVAQAFRQLNLKSIQIDQLREVDFQILKSRINKISSDIYRKGFVDLDQPNDSSLLMISLRYKTGGEKYTPVKNLISSEAELEEFIVQRSAAINPELKNFLLEILLSSARPNIKFDPQETELARDRKRALASPVQAKIKAGSPIIEKGTYVTEEDAAKIESLINELKKQNGNENFFMTFFSQFLIILMITGLILVYLWFNKPRLYFDYKKLALLLFTFLLATGAMVVSTKLTVLAEKLGDTSPAINLSYIYLAPACIVPIFISSFFDYRLAIQANILVALYGSVLVQQGLEFAFVQIIAGSVAVYSLRKLRKRDTFFITLGYIFLAYSLAYVAFNLLSKGSFIEINYRTLLIFGINVVLTVITYNLIYLMERIFGVTSDLTYLELLDTNYPLLQELSRKAPGTFQHSLQVANIAEATIKEIGGNALLTHVGALYHDIGKMAHPSYFIENMSEEDKEDNPHSKINCEESAEIIIGHVKAGAEMAQKYHLPNEIIDFIRMHHGTTRVEYFYRQYLAENQCEAPEAEELFRYPGPLPNSKETAVLMISDSIEAASRSLKNPTPEKLKELVDSILNHKIRDHQLEESNLTFKDISIIRSVIKKQLLSIYHGRIEYPKERA